MSTELDTIADSSTLDILPPKQSSSVAAQQMLRAHASMMQDAYELASKMVLTSMVPARFLRKPEDATAAILYGAELGLNPIQSLQRIIPIHGMPTLESRTMVGLLKARGYKIRTVEQSDTSVTVEGEAPDGERATSTWTIERAEKAGYTKNAKYDTDPQAMLKAKGQAEVCRELAPDVLLGISYSREELESEGMAETRGSAVSAPPRASAPVTIGDIFAEEVPVPAPAPEPASPEAPAGVADQDATPDAAPTTNPTPAEPATSNSGSEPEPTQASAPAKKAPAKKAATKSQRDVSPRRAPLEKRMFGLLGDAQIKLEDREDRIAIYRAIVGRDDVTSTNDLADDEVALVGDQLYKWQQANVLDEQLAGILDDAALAAENAAQSAESTTTEGTK